MKEVKSYFDIAAQNYSERSESSIWGWLKTREAKVVSDAIGTEALGDVLELGSGTGYYTRLLYHQGCKSITCVDFSQNMLDKCRIHGCVKIVANVQEYISKDKFDLILCAGVLEFLQYPEKIFYNASKMLKEKGILVILIPPISILGYLYKLFHQMHDIKIKLFQLDELKEWAKKVDLATIMCKRVVLFSLVMKFSKQGAMIN